VVGQHTAYALGPRDLGNREINKIPCLLLTAGCSWAKADRSNHGTPFPSIDYVLRVNYYL
jgi:hypothetical protein